MNNNRVEGVYNNVDEAMRAVEALRDRGYPRENITIVANEEVRDSFPWNVDAEVTTRNTDTTDSGDNDRSFWDSIKDAFTTDDSYSDSNYDNPDYDGENDPVYEYRDDINQGSIVVLVREGADVEGATTKTATTPGMTSTDMDTPTMDNEVDGESIKLREERLDVKKEDKTGDVHVGKRVVEETETIDVPVRKEEVVIERKPVRDGDKHDGGTITGDAEETVIPVREETVRVEKDTEVVEEVDVRKETTQDTRTVQDTVRHEELDVEKEGDARIEDVRQDDTFDDGTPANNRFNNDRVDGNSPDPDRGL